METPKIIHIAAAAVPGERRTFVNVYGLDDQSRVWQWNAKLGRWQPNKLQLQPKTGNLYDGRNGDHEARGGGF
jgi:hypothetical protein